jgi:hypothetical protein
VVKPDRLEGREYSCRFSSVVTRWDARISTATKTPLGAYIARIVGRCSGEGCQWRVVADIYYAKGMLVMKELSEGGKRYLGGGCCFAAERP